MMTIEKLKKFKEQCKNIFRKVKFKLLGKNFSDGWIYKICIYTLLISIGYIFLFPIIEMISTSFMDLDDLLSPMVVWFPTKFYFGNYQMSFQTLNYFKAFFSSLQITLLPAIIQTIVCAFTAYGFAKFEFKFKKIIFALVLLSYILPAQITMIPKYVLFTNLKITNNPLSIILPSLLGQGLNSAIFIFIFYQFFRMLPKSLDEAALIDGANRYYIFYKIAIPLSIPAFITTFLFSFVWYWNETYITSIFLGDSVTTLQLNLVAFNELFNATSSQGSPSLNEGIKSAGTVLVMLPMLIMYFFLQKHLIEGIDKAGLAGGE